MAAKQAKTTSQPPPDRLAGTQANAKPEGRHLQSVQEEAKSTETNFQGGVRPEVMDHFRASLERNRRLGELLADS